MPAERKVHEVVIVGAARTPIGAFQGSLASLPGPRLGAVAIKAALERAQVKPDEVKTVFMGEVLQGGVGQAPARQAAIYAGIPNSVPCVTVNKVCGSGLEAVIEGARVIALGEADVVVAGGMESMSNAPYFSSSIRNGARMGNTELKDLMIHDGLWDPYNDMHMGMCGEKCAADFQFSRSAQDEYARESTLRAQKAQKEGAFKAEIAPVEIVDRKGNKTVVDEDEGPEARQARQDRLAQARLQEGRHGHRGQRIVHQRRRRRGGADERRAGQEGGTYRSWRGWATSATRRATRWSSPSRRPTPSTRR